MDVDISIILATYNEAFNLPLLLDKIDWLHDLRKQVIFVDDGSIDSTRTIILDYTKKEPSSKYIFNEHRQGILGSQSQGTMASDGDFIVVMDSDLQHPPELIPAILEKLKGGYDIVIGSRYTEGGSTGNRDPVRGIISRIASFLAKSFLKSSRSTTDPLSGYVGFRKSLYKPVNQKWRGYELLLFILAENPMARVCDLPYVFRGRADGESKVVKGTQFIRIFLTQLILVKRVEIEYRSRISRLRSF